MKRISLVIIGLFTAVIIYSQNCTKLGTFIGTFQPSFFTYLDAEQPQIARTILNDANISFIANNPIALSNFVAFLDSLNDRNIETVLSIRFEYGDSLGVEDRIISDSIELNTIMINLQTVLSASNGKLAYLQGLNEPFGVGRYNITYDSLANISTPQIAEQTILAWMDTIAHRFRSLIDNQSYSIQLLSPSVQIKGLEAVRNNNTSFWTYKVTLKIFEIADTYCDVLNFHWYPDSLQQMQELMGFIDTATVLLISPNVKKSCTEWSQAHEIKIILQSDTAFWNNELSIHCGTSDPNLESTYLALINDSLGIDHTNTYDMYQLMNSYDYEFASYFAMVQDFYTCGSSRMSWYALAGLYATRFTANKVPNGAFYTQYQNIKQYILDNCDTLTIIDDFSRDKKTISIYPNPANTVLFINNNPKPNFRYQIFNILGQPVSYLVTTSLNEIDIRNLTNGIYFFVIYEDNSSNSLMFLKE